MACGGAATASGSACFGLGVSIGWGAAGLEILGGWRSLRDGGELIGVGLTVDGAKGLLLRNGGALSVFPTALTSPGLILMSDIDLDMSTILTSFSEGEF